MCNYVQALFLAMVVCSLHVQCRAQGYTYSTYSNPYQNSFAFSTPNLKQMFTTKLANAPSNQLNQLQLQDQQYYNNLAQQNFPQSANLYSTTPQQFANQDDQLRQQLAYLQLQQLQQQQYQLQQEQLQQQPQLQQQQQQQLYQQQQQQLHQQQQQQLQQQQQFHQQQQTEYEQFQQAPFYPNSRDANQQTTSFERQQQQQQQEKLRTQNLLGVAYSPSTKVSQVKFDSAKLKYDF